MLILKFVWVAMHNVYSIYDCLKHNLKVVGDPTVEIFGSRDIDSFIQDREAFAVQVNRLLYR